MNQGINDSAERLFMEDIARWTTKKEPPKAVQTVVQAAIFQPVKGGDSSPYRPVVRRTTIPLRTPVQSKTSTCKTSTFRKVEEVTSSYQTHFSKGESFMSHKMKSGGAFILVLLLYLGWLALNQAWTDHRDAVYRQSRMEDIAVVKAEADAAVIRAKAEREIAALKLPIAAPVKVGQEAFNCDGQDSIENGYGSRTMHSLNDIQSSTIKGCMWVAITRPVQSVSGKDYRLEVPYDANSSYKCPKEDGADCMMFLNEIFAGQNYPIKQFRVITKPGGYVTIN